MELEELVNSVGLATELPEWKDMTPDEKMQREPDLNRVVNEICPYFIEDPDRFFSNLIIDIYAGKHRYSASPAFCEETVRLHITSAEVIVMDSDLHEVVRHRRLYGDEHESMDWIR